MEKWQEHAKGKKLACQRIQHCWFWLWSFFSSFHLVEADQSAKIAKICTHRKFPTTWYYKREPAIAGHTAVAVMSSCINISGGAAFLFVVSEVAAFIEEILY